VKIALLIHELLVNGGGERQCVCLARALARQGHTVTVFTCAYDMANCFPEICRDLTIKVVGRGAIPSLRNPWLIRGYLDMRHLAAFINEEHDIWNPHHWPAQWGGVWLKRRLGGAVLWMCNDVPNFYLKARQSGNSVSAGAHWLYYLYDRQQNNKIDLTVLVSNWANRDFKAIYDSETRVIGPGVDTGQFRPGGDGTKIRRRFGYADDDFVLLWLGIFMPHRRLEDAIEAVSDLVCRGLKIRLLLAGSDRSHPQYVESLRRRAVRLGVQQYITFVSKLADDEIRDFYCACDGFVFPNDQQTWGLAALEAMACGCPVLVSQGAGVHEVLTDLENAVLFPPGNPRVLAERIASLIANPESRRKIAQNGMQLARENYNWNRYANQVSDLCQQLMPSKDSHVPVPASSSSYSAQHF